jgi:hypothetical protein
LIKRAYIIKPKLVIQMVKCEKCGVLLPNGAEYCPNCGSPVIKTPQAVTPSTANISKLLQAGLSGAFISVLVQFFIPSSQLYFLPSFAGALVAIYVFQARRLDEAIMISLCVYLFADAIIVGVVFGSIYIETGDIVLSQIYEGQVVTLFDIVMYAANPVTAIIAGYIGNRLIAKPTAKQTSPYAYQGREGQGGIVFSTDVKEEASTFPSHNV